MSWELWIALGLLFLALSSILPYPTGKLVAVIVSCVSFLLAAILTFYGGGGPPTAPSGMSADTGNILQEVR